MRLQTSPSGGTIIGPDGRAVALPPGGQPTGPGRGAYREDGGKSSKEIAKAMDTATTSAGEATAGADEAVKATKDFSAAQTAANETVAVTFREQAGVMGELTAAAVKASADIRAIYAELQTLRQQVAAARARR